MATLRFVRPFVPLDLLSCLLVKEFKREGGCSPSPFPGSRAPRQMRVVLSLPPHGCHCHHRARKGTDEIFSAIILGFPVNFNHSVR